MKPERWQQIDQLLEAALERPPAERAAFLAAACAGDETLRQAVESLLRSDEQAESFIEAPAVALAAEVLAERQARTRIGEQLGQYQILSRLGAGGMGEVFLAQDARLGRKVALKLLPAHFTTDAERVRRFEQEGRAASALNHPNIITIYDIGQANGVYYIATEFIEGQTLRQQMTGNWLKLREVLDVATQVASGLSAAHAAGIVRRDLKPENVMVRPDGLAKILDFGLAKLTEPQTSTVDTEAPTAARVETELGTVMGTVRYMSPEQARGLKVDARTDLFSLGVVLYELIAGQAPFAGATAADVIAAILGKEPAPLQHYTPEAPEALEWIVSKALRKEREERYQIAEEMRADLKRLRQDLEIAARMGSSASARVSEEAAAEANQTAAAHPASGVKSVLGGIKRPVPAALMAAVALSLAVALMAWLMNRGQGIDSLAVLPFVNASGDPNTEYLSDGITESLINSLSQLPRLKVMSRNSVFRYKGSETDAQKAGNALGVRAVLTGRVTQRGNDLLVSAELVDARDNSHLWGEQYNRKLADILTVQEEIAKQISEKLRLRLSGEEQKRLTKRYSDNAEAYQAYLKGRFYSAKATESGLKQGIEYFNQAIAIDPNYALAWAGLANGYWEDSNIHIAPHDAMPKAKQAALKALAIDDTLAEAHAALGIALTAYDWDWPKAENEFRRAIELNPDYPTAHAYYGWYLSLMARPEEALAELKRAIQLDPVSSEYNGILGLALYWARRHDQAVAQLWKALELNPNDWLVRTYLSWALISQGKFSEAITELQRARQIDDNQYVLGALGEAYALSGNRSEALKAIEQLKERSKQHYISPNILATIYAGLGENDLAFEWLEKAIEARSEHLTWLKVDPELDPLRSDPRFTALARRIGLAP